MSQAGVTSSGSGGSGIETIDGDTGSVTGSTVTITGGSTGYTFSGSGATLTLEGSGSGITTIDCDTGSISGSTVTINAFLSAGGTVTFQGSGSFADLTFSDPLGNTCLGQFSGGVGISGPQNCGLGYSSLNSLGEGLGNIGIGYESLVALPSGIYNVAIGYQSGNAYTSTESNNILISNPGVINESNVMRIGATGTGNQQQNMCYIGGIQSQSVVGSAIYVTTGDQLGILSSSIRYKENISALSFESRAIYDLKPVTFNYKTDEAKSLQYGLIAEEVEKSMPNLVLYNKDHEPESVKYQYLPILLLKEVQRLNEKVNELSKKLGSL
jgi:hypothetical protein